MKINKLQNREEFNNIIIDIIENDVVKKMKNYRQHCDVSCFDHCYHTSYCCYNICKKLKLDYVSAARAAMLHDLFLYDWRVKSNREGLHAFTHPKTAYNNANDLFNLNDKEKNMILSHMWPLTLTMPPKSLESFILTIVDKYSATKESFDYFIETMKKNELMKYSYLILSFVIFRIHKWGNVLLVAIIRNL